MAVQPSTVSNRRRRFVAFSSKTLAVPRTIDAAKDKTRLRYVEARVPREAASVG